jgi:hypothetical protein
VLQDLVDLLDRQYGYLCALDGVPFIRQLRKYLGTLSVDPRLAALMDDMRREASDLIDAYKRHDAEMVARLVALKKEFVTLVPEADDSNTPKPESIEGKFRWTETLAYFDHVAATEGLISAVVPTAAPDDPSRTGKLQPLLRRKIYNAQWIVRTEDGGYRETDKNQRPDLDDLAMHVVNIELIHEPILYDLINDHMTSGGVALVILEDFVTKLTPRFKPHQSKGDLLLFANQAKNLVLTGLDKLHDDLYGSSRGDGKVAKDWVTRLRPVVARFHEGLRARVGARRSLLGLLHRFKSRCEWHDGERLRTIMARTGAHENDLTAEFARWLFDQGLNPITQPLMAGLEPDLLDPSFRPTVYVEAKRYKSAKGSRDHLRKGIFQLHDTVARLNGTPYQVREAFFLVFREGGPRYVIPDTVRGEGWVVFPVLVDISPASESGSRQKDRPIVIPAEEWMPK